MPIHDLRQFTQDAGKAGRNVARIIRILAKVLLCWSAHHAKCKATKSGSADKSLPPLKAIEFDKLSEIVCRIWDELHKQRKVRFRSALLQRRGFHGPGRALKIDRKEDEILGKDPDDIRHTEWAYTTEIVDKLKPPWSNTRTLFRLDGKSFEPGCKIYPGLESSLWDSWLSNIMSATQESQFLTQSEITYVEVISTVISQLDKGEIRALGTHYRATETRKDISFNFKALRREFEKIINCLQGITTEPKIEDAAYIMVTTSREILRKSKDNMKTYETAYNKCKKCLHELGPKGLDIFNAFIEVQHSGNRIWSDDFISKVGKNAQVLVSFCVYCRRVLFSQRVVSKLTKREKKEAEGAYERLQAFMARENISLSYYDEVESLSRLELSNILNRIMAKVLSCFPFTNRLQHLGVP